MFVPNLMLLSQCEAFAHIFAGLNIHWEMMSITFPENGRQCVCVEEFFIPLS